VHTETVAGYPQEVPGVVHAVLEVAQCQTGLVGEPLHRVQGDLHLTRHEHRLR
jgi:hypothetical protein